MHVEIAKWGNSLALRIPAKMARENGLTQGVKAELRSEDGALIIAAAKVLPAMRRSPRKQKKSTQEGVEKARAALARIPKSLSEVDDFLAWRKTQWDDHYL